MKNIYKVFALVLITGSFFYPNISSAQAAVDLQSVLRALQDIVSSLKPQVSTTEKNKLLSAVAAASLSKGSKDKAGSTEVTTLQVLLKLPADSQTGYFGSVTEAAVKAAQKDAGLPTTGVADFKTVTTIVSKPVEVKPIAPANPTVVVIPPPNNQANGCSVGYCLGQDLNGWTQFNPSPDSKIVYLSTSGIDSIQCVYSPAGSTSYPQIVGDPFNPTGAKLTAGGATVPIAPCRQIAYGLTHLRPNMPDWMLFKKGDSWNQQGNNNLTMRYTMRLGGRGFSEPMLISSYGPDSAPQPVLSTTGAVVDMFTGPMGTEWRYMAITDLRLVGSFMMVGSFKNILIEGNNISGQINTATDRCCGGGPVNNGQLLDSTIRRNVIHDAPSLGYITSGLNQSIRLEENNFDHNGYDANGHTYNQNHHIYLGFSPGDTGTVSVGENFFTRGADGGKYNTLNGVIENNTYLQNATAVDACCGPNTTIRNNVVVDANDYFNVPVNPMGRGFALGIHDSQVAPSMSMVNPIIEGNILAHQHTGANNTGNVGYAFAFGLERLNANSPATIRDNVVYNWCSPGSNSPRVLELSLLNGQPGNPVTVEGNDFQQQGCTDGSYVYVANSGNAPLLGNTYRNNKYSLPNASRFAYIGGADKTFTQWTALTGDTSSIVQTVSYPDPNRDAATYMNSLFGTSYAFKSQAGLDALVARLMQQRKGNWDSRLTAPAFNDYIRAGFGVASGGSCNNRADMNGDGVLNSLDFAAMSNAFAAGSLTADFNNDGRLNVLDFSTFLNTYAVGC